jgi:hypothetical protein
MRLTVSAAFRIAAPPEPEVRRCARCARAAVLCVKAWAGGVSFLGMDAGPTGTIERRDYRCQECGAAFTLLDPGQRRLTGVLGLLLFGMLGLAALTIGGAGWIQGDPAAPTVVVVGAVLGALAGAIAAWMFAPYRIDRRNPRMPGAPVPAMRFGADEPAARACRCGAPAVCAGITEFQSRGVSQGRRVRFRCTACKREFDIESAGSLAGMALATLVFGAIGVALLECTPGNGWFAWVFSGGVTAFGALGGVLFVLNLVERLRHPLVG